MKVDSICPQVHAHAAARLPFPKLHETESVHQVFPQSGEGGDIAQSLPVGLPGRRMYQLPHTDRGRPAPALQSRLREIVEEDLRPVSREQRVGHHDMAIQGPTGRESHQDVGGPWFLRAELARTRRLQAEFQIHPACYRRRSSKSFRIEFRFVRLVPPSVDSL